MKWARKAYMEAQAKEAAKFASPAIVVQAPKVTGDLMEELKHLNLQHWAQKLQPALEPAGEHEDNEVHEAVAGVDCGIDHGSIPLDAALECLSAHGIIVKEMSTNIASFGHSEVTLELHLVGGDALQTLKAIQDWSTGKKFTVG